MSLYIIFSKLPSDPSHDYFIIYVMKAFYIHATEWDVEDQSCSLCLGPWSPLATHTLSHLHPGGTWGHHCLWVITNCPPVTLSSLTLEPGWVFVALPWSHVFVTGVLFIDYVSSSFSLILWLIFKFWIFAFTSYWIIKAFHIKRIISINVWSKKKTK